MEKRIRIDDKLFQFKQELIKHVDGEIRFDAGDRAQICVHRRISFDLVTKRGVQAYRSFVNEATDMVIKYGGS